MIKIMITGASGMLGAEVCLKLKNNFNVYAFSHSSSFTNKSLNILDINQVNSIIKSINPDVIINCAAFTNVDFAEKKRLEARNVNVLGLSNIIKACSKKVKIIHISTDYVFDGMEAPYKESDLKKPLNYYGKTKLEAENLLIGANLNSLIIRPNVLYTSDLTKRNFFSWVLSSLNNKNKIEIVSDQYSNPVFIPDLVKIIEDSILVDYSGISHFGSEDSLSRYEFAIKIADTFKLDKKLIKSTTTEKLNQAAQRPLNTTLDCSKIETDLEIDLFATEYSLKRILPLI